MHFHVFEKVSRLKSGVGDVCYSHHETDLTVHVCWVLAFIQLLRSQPLALVLIHVHSWYWYSWLPMTPIPTLCLSIISTASKRSTAIQFESTTRAQVPCGPSHLLPCSTTTVKEAAQCKGRLLKHLPDKETFLSQGCLRRLQTQQPCSPLNLTRTSPRLQTANEVSEVWLSWPKAGITTKAPKEHMKILLRAMLNYPCMLPDSKRQRGTVPPWAQEIILVLPKGKLCPWLAHSWSWLQMEHFHSQGHFYMEAPIYHFTISQWDGAT